MGIHRYAMAASCAALLALSAQAGVDISSPDGMWSASLDANNTGQITNLFRDGGDNLFETLFYEASSASGGVSARVESNYSNTGFDIGANSAEFDLLRNDSLMSLNVHIQMLDGANGGALHTLTWTYLGTAAEDVKPFAYADLDVNASAGGDDANFVAGSVLQSDGPADIYFGGTQDYSSWEIQTFSGLRTELDAGRLDLTSSGSVADGDGTAALSGAAATLFNGDSLVFTFQLGGEAIIPAPGALALIGMAGLITRRRRRH